MLTSLNRMTGLPVVWQERQLGHVERAVADLNSMYLDGVVVRRGIGSARWAPRAGIVLIGQNSVILSQPPVRLPTRQIVEKHRTLSTGGGSAGMVSDVILSGDTLRIAALEISQGPIYRLMGRCVYAPCEWANNSGEQRQVVLPPLLSWMQLLSRFGEGEDA